MSKGQDFAIGIDLGTTNSSIAVCYNDGKVQIIQNDQTGHRITPSYVAFDDGMRTVGLSAKQCSHENPQNTVFEMKRILGREFDDPEISRNMERWPFKVVKGPQGKPFISVEELEVVNKYSPVDISSFVLENLKNFASEFLGKPIVKAVITVPAKFNDAQRKATREAGERAGLQVIGMINEPTAAAIGYKIAGSGTQTFLVFDFGGGTLDVSILQYDGISRFSVLATEGNMMLGGADFDGRLLQHYIKQFQKEHNIDLRNHPRALTLLRQQCESVKNNLSAPSSKFARASVACIVGSTDLQYKTTLQEFEKLCEDLFLKILEPVKNALRVAKKSEKDLDFVLLVGGSSRMPKVREVLKNFFGDVPLKYDAFTDEAIAIGAAVYANCVMQKQAGLPTQYHVLDITPFTLGVAASGGKMIPLIPKGSIVPVQMEKFFTTVIDGATQATVKIYEGESKITAENNYLGELQLRNMISTTEARPQIGVKFAYDDSGVLTVTASDKAGNQEAAIVLVMT